MDPSLDDFEPRPINGRLTGAKKKRAQEAAVVIDFNDPESRERAASDAHDEVEEEFLKEWTEWEKGLVEWDRRQLDEAKRLKEERDLTARLDRNDRRVGNIIDVAFKDNGDVDESILDGHAEGGIGLGLSSQAIRAASSFYRSAYFSRSRRPFVISMNGRKRDNRVITESVSCLLDELLVLAEFKKVAGRRGRSAFKNGTAILDYELTQRLEYINEGGQFIETRSRIVPELTLWPLRDFYCSNPNMLDPADQECIWLVKRSATIRDLEANEATWDFELDPETMAPSGYRRTEGIFFGLRRVREMRAGLGVGTRTGSTGDDRSVSAFPTFDLVRARGAIPFEVFEELKFTPRMAKWIGVDVGMGAFDETDPEEMDEFWYRLARIPVWKWSRTDANTDAGTEGDGSEYLVEFRPSENGTNGVYAYRYGEDDEEFYGYGIPDLGETIEKICEILANAQAVIAEFNAKPSFLVDKNAFITKTRDEIRKLFRPGQLVEKQGGRAIAEIIERMELDTPANIEHWVMFWREAFFDQVGVLPAIMGNAEANTLGQDQLNKANAQNILEDVVLEHASEDYRLFRQIVKDYWVAAGPDGFRQELRNVSGYAAVGIDDAISDTERVWETIAFDHPAAFGKDPFIVASQLDAKFGIYGVAGVMDPYSTCQTSVGLIYPQTDEVMAGGFKILKPEDEWLQMISKDTVEPSAKMPPEELDMHVMQHLTMLKILETGQLRIAPDNMKRLLARMTPEDVEDFKDRLKGYLVKAAIIKRMQEARAMQEAAQAAGPAGAPGKAQRGENDQRNDMKKKVTSKVPGRKAA